MAAITLKHKKYVGPYIIARRGTGDVAWFYKGKRETPETVDFLWGGKLVDAICYDLLADAKLASMTVGGWAIPLDFATALDFSS